MLQSLLKNKKFLLFIIVLLAGILRFYQLGANPIALTWDEVALGYNAYSISIDGRDEFGKFMPYEYFLSFGDYKPPVYVYLSVLPIMLFGLTEFAVRFPSAFFGTITVLISYFLVKEIFRSDEKKDAKTKIFSEYVALLTTLLLAISPWHMMLSRAAFEANVSSFFIISGVWLFLFSIRKKPYLLVLSVLCFVASIYTFNSTRVVAPLLFLLLASVHFKSLWALKKQTVTAAVVGIIALAPLVPHLLAPQAKLRFEEVNFFSDVSLVETSNQQQVNDNNAWWSNIIHNRRVIYTNEFFKHYFDHFNPNFLFIQGDGNPKFSTKDVGQLYLWELPFFFVGMVFLFRQRKGKWWLIPLWLLIGIIPAAVARETPHALRIESTLPTWQIFSAYGLTVFLLSLKRYKVFIGSLLAATITLFLIYYLHGYYTHYSKEYSLQWQYTYKEAVQYLNAHKDSYQRIHIADTLERGYIYTLFYQKYDPRKFREQAKIRGNDFGFMHIDSYDKFYFTYKVEDLPTNGQKTLYLSSSKDVPVGVKVLKKFHLVNGDEYITIYTR